MYLFVWILLFSLQHIVSEVELGTKKIERYKSSYVDFFKYAMKNVSFCAHWNWFLPSNSMKYILLLGVQLFLFNYPQGKVTFHLVPTPRWVPTYHYASKSHSDNENKLANNLQVLVYRSSLEHLTLSCAPITQLKFET